MSDIVEVYKGPEHKDDEPWSVRFPEDEHAATIQRVSLLVKDPSFVVEKEGWRKKMDGQNNVYAYVRGEWVKSSFNDKQVIDLITRDWRPVTHVPEAGPYFFHSISNADIIEEEVEFALFSSYDLLVS